MEGPLEQFTHEMEPFLRKQGMPVRLNKGELYCFLLAAMPHTLKVNFLILILSVMHRCGRTCFRFCCVWRGKAFVAWVGSYTGLFCTFCLIFRYHGEAQVGLAVCAWLLYINFQNFIQFLCFAVIFVQVNEKSNICQCALNYWFVYSIWSTQMSLSM